MTTTAADLSLHLTARGVNAAEAFSVTDVLTGRTCAYIARTYADTFWSVHTDNGIFLGPTSTVTSALDLIATYYNENEV